MRLVVGVALALAAVFVTSCMMVETAAPRVIPSRFDHSAHAADRELDCGFCHVPDREGKMRRPGPQLCTPCHEQLGLGPESLDVETLFDESGRYRATGVADLGPSMLFDHNAHQGHAECADCHGDIATSDGIPMPSIQKDDCMDCHASSGASNECSVCHVAIDRHWQPATHGGLWEREHGAVVRREDDALVNRCELCHVGEQSCDACHRLVQPRSHTNFFRIRGHGILASIDRESCVTCHRPDFCNRCHQVTPPRSHRAGFGSPRNRHCVGCHTPLADSGCATCHKATPSHRGPGLPPGHHPAMDCRRCHGNGVRLPHPDNGTQCTDCHR